jgi:hypothetical protein
MCVDLKCLCRQGWFFLLADLTYMMVGDVSLVFLEGTQMTTSRRLQVGVRAAKLPTAVAFDYGSQAELFPTRGRKCGRQQFRYKRFDQAAYAIRFAIEELPPDVLLGALLEVNEERYDSKQIRLLYESVDYPLARRAASS